MSDVPETPASMEDRALECMRGVMDPEIGLNVVDLGLVYGIDVTGTRIHVKLTMTTPACPLGEEIMQDAEGRLRAIDGVDDVVVELVWYPPWGPERMTPEARRVLGWAK